MGYTTYFYGQIDITPPLNAEEVAYIKKFNEARHMQRGGKSPYSVDGSNDWQKQDGDVTDYNNPPAGQPGLWCGWTCSDDGTTIEHDGGEKFYDSAEWMKYLIDHFLGDSPLAKKELPFLQGHTCNGEIIAAGDDRDDNWKLIVKANKVTTQHGSMVYDAEREV
jgi:hypothetical protein